MVCACQLLHLGEEWAHLRDVAVVVAPIDISADIVQGTDGTCCGPHRLFAGHKTAEGLHLRVVIFTIGSDVVYVVDDTMVTKELFVGWRGLVQIATDQRLELLAARRAVAIQGNRLVYK